MVEFALGGVVGVVVGEVVDGDDLSGSGGGEVDDGGVVGDRKSVV